MKSVMLTIRLKWFYLTYKGIKTIEVRKTAPKDFVGDVYEVVSKTNFEKDLMEIPKNEREFFRQFKGKVGLKFTLNKVEEITSIISKIFNSKVDDIRYLTTTMSESEVCYKSRLEYKELKKYLDGNIGYAWHISNLEIFDEPKELSEFKTIHKYKTCDDCPHFADDNYLYCDKCEETKPLTKSPQSYTYIEVPE
ncbi:MAG: hypothetical protein K5765_06625 [Clostridia bacterium]|nr:hypothetical protein [Clostridia bacterium]